MHDYSNLMKLELYKLFQFYSIPVICFKSFVKNVYSIEHVFHNLPLTTLSQFMQNCVL